MCPLCILGCSLGSSHSSTFSMGAKKGLFLGFSIRRSHNRCFVRSVSILSLVGSASFFVRSVNTLKLVVSASFFVRSVNTLKLVGSMSFFVRSVNIPRLVDSAIFLVRSISVLTLVGSGSTGGQDAI